MGSSKRPHFTFPSSPVFPQNIIQPPTFSPPPHPPKKNKTTKHKAIMSYPQEQQPYYGQPPPQGLCAADADAADAAGAQGGEEPRLLVHLYCGHVLLLALRRDVRVLSRVPRLLLLKPIDGAPLRRSARSRRERVTRQEMDGLIWAGSEGR
ncbi:hypothetical protein BT67DRAFT_52592 [Trichocladium antarcticum]|uniref:Spondin domain-containing protein n=1 Tax=Trichocladium antarcticum TaxID=1450529 RepID=A0AAN6ZD55_9PEZI|nr:hypothetical protein BT67DRAFT_52592 [Trichocladium antarcticum]